MDIQELISARKKPFFYILCFILVTVLLISCQNRTATHLIPEIKKGRIDLSAWDFYKDGPVSLSGEWNFYWNHHISPRMLMEKTLTLTPGFIQVPGAWNNTVTNGETVTGFGFATYHASVTIGDSDHALGLKILDMATAFRLYVNGTLITSSGVPGQTADQTTPFYSPQVVDIEPHSGKIDIVVHVSNFHHWQGGMWEPVLIGQSRQLYDIRQNNLIVDAVLFGIICIMGAYHLGLFYSRPKDRSTLFFGLFCLMIAFRIITHGERYVITFFPGIHYDLLMKFIYISTYSYIPLFVAYTHLLFPKHLPKKMVGAAFGIGLIFILITLFSAVDFYSRGMPVYQLLICLFLLYGIYVICLCLKNNLQGSIVFFIGFSALLVTGLNDILYSRQVISTGYFVPFGLVIFIFSQAVLLSQRFSNAFLLVEQQGATLKKEIRQRQKSEQKAREMIDLLPIPVSEYDFKFNVSYANQAALTSFGYTREDFSQGVSVSDLIPEEYFEEIASRIKKLEKGENPGPIELRLKKKDQSEVWGQVTPSLIFKGENPVGIRACFVDLSEQKRMEQAMKFAAEQEKYALVGQIAGKMAHDFNNILGAIMGNAELALLDTKEDKTRDKLTLIFEQTIRGKNLTKNLIAFAKDQDPKQEYFPLQTKIELVLSLLKKDLEKIHVIKEFDEQVPDILADPGMIEHAFVNVVQNSVHALSLVETPVIIIRTYTLDRQICIEIEDNGCGIPKNSLKKIFEPSFTLKGSKDESGAYKSGIKGTGYGMANVKKYIDQHKGNIHILSTPQKGTNVIICLPIENKVIPQKKAVPENRYSITSRMNILLVEDETSISDVQYKLLTKPPHYHTVDIARDGHLAIDYFNKNDYDFVCLDYILPGGIDGMGVYHHIRKTDKTIPILFISGNLEFIESIKTLKQEDHYIDHLSKPCTSSEYIDGIGNLFKKTHN